MSKGTAFLSILKKNFKLLLRSKSSAAIIILGPLLIVILLGFAFSSGQNELSLSVGIYSEKYSDLTNSVVQKMASKFEVYKFESVSDCVKYVRRGKVNLCVAFPPNLDVKGQSNEVTFYVDYSRINAVWMILDVISEKISSESTDISTKLTDIMLNKMALTQNESESDGKLISVMLNENDELNVKVTELYGDLRSLDLSAGKVDTEKFEETTGYVAQLCTDVANISLYLVDRINDKMTDANCSDPQVIENIIDHSKDELRSKSKSIIQTISENGTFQEELSFLLTSVDETEKQLESAKDIRDDATTNPLISKKIGEQKKSLVELQSSLEKIKDELATLEIKDSSRIVNPITTKIEPVTLEVSYFNSFFPTLIVLIVMITSILLASTIVMNEKKSASFFRTAISPISAFWFNLGTYVTTFLIVVVQLIVFLIVAVAFTNLGFLSGVHFAILSLIFIISVFVLFGMLVGYWFKSEETTMLGAVSFSCLFLFLSSIILPVETMPHYIQFIVQYNPFVVGENLLRQALIFHSGILAFINGIIIMIAWVALFFVITYLLIKFSGRNGVYKRKRK